MSKNTNLAQLIVRAKPFDAPTEAHQTAWNETLAELQKIDPAMVDSYMITVRVKVGTYKCDHCDEDHDDLKQVIAAAGPADFLPALAAAAVGSLEERTESEKPDAEGIYEGNELPGGALKRKATH